jgi:biotin carboxyl carrier protein
VPKIFLVILALGGLIGAFVLFGQGSKNFISRPALQNENEPPLKLKSIGVNFEDFKVTKAKLQFNRLFMDYGFVIPSNQTSSGKSKANPQPTYILPLGTPVRSLVDGVVSKISTVWSGDYSIHVTSTGKLEKWTYETEHVLNPKVKVGDKVSAGQIIAEVSNFDKSAPEGFGAVEIGILHSRGDGLPEHICPFVYLDDSIKDDTFRKMKDFFKSWEKYIGDQSLYDESLEVPGCLTLDPIEG